MSGFINVCFLDLEKDEMTGIENKTIEASFDYRRRPLQSNSRCVGVDDVSGPNEYDLVQLVQQANMFGLWIGQDMLKDLALLIHEKRRLSPERHLPSALQFA